MMINKDNYELFAIDYIEGTLDQETKSAMDKFLAEHPSFKSEMDALIDPVIIEADHSIVFDQKSLLKKESKKPVAWIWAIRRSAAAAVIALAIAAAWIINSNNTVIDSPIIIANNQPNKNTNATEKNNQEETIKPKTPKTQIAISNSEKPKIKTPKNQSPKHQTTLKETKRRINEKPIINEPMDATAMATIREDAVVADASIAKPSEIIDTPETIDIEQINGYDLKNITATNMETPTIPMDLIADANAQVSKRKKKGQWLINAITKKSDGTEIFAFQGLKKALTPTRLRDARVDKASSDSPLKKLTDD